MEKNIYDYKISMRLKRWINVNKIRLLWTGITTIFLHVLLYIFWILIGGDNYANQQLFQWLPEILIIDIGGLIVGFVYLAWYKIPKEIYDEEGIQNESKIPTNIDLAYQINIKIQEFKISLVSIKTLQAKAKEQRSVLEDARQILEKIQNIFSQSKIFFTHHKPIEEVIGKIHSLFEDYRVYVGMLARKEFDGIRTEFTIKKELWGTLDDKNSIEGKILTEIEELIELLSKENEPKLHNTAAQESIMEEDNKEIYQPYQVEDGDTWESISDKLYGSDKFANRLRIANEYASPISTGQVINIPTIRFSSLSRENGKYVCLKMINGNSEKPVLCKAIIKKMEIWEENEWSPIDTSEDGPLSWHLGGSDNNGFKEVFLSPEFINIAKLHKLPLSDKIVFTHIVDKYRKAGRFRLLIEIIYKFADRPRIEKWYGYIDKNDGRLEIIEMGEINEWK